MALSTILMRELCKRLSPGARIASMGYPDIVARHKDVESILGSNIYSLKHRGDSDEIRRVHGGSGDVPDAHSFFDLQGAKLDVFDVAAHRGGEIIVDLNYPYEGSEPYDFVLDIGTLEHCFNIAQAALNMAGLLRKGGVILHENPFNWGNHGFYNINPTWYADFYGQPGFKLLDMKMVVTGKELNGQEVGNVHPTRRFGYLGSEANMIAIAERVEILPIGFPVQTKYAKSIKKANMATPA